MAASGGRSAAAGRGAAGSAGGKLTAECQEVANNWPASSAPDELLLLQRLNELRANPFQVCETPLRARALVSDEQLKCIARLRFPRNNPPRGGGSPSYITRTVMRGDSDEQEEDLRNRAKIAGYVADESNLAELVVENVDDANEIAAGIAGAPNRRVICGALLYTGLVGIAHRGDMWVVDLAPPTMNSPARSGPNPGDH